jgi:hypothetical protein
MGRFACVVLLATTPCSIGLAALAISFVYPIPILNLGLAGFKQELSNNQVTARIGYKF